MIVRLLLNSDHRLIGVVLPTRSRLLRVVVVPRVDSSGILTNFSSQWRPSSQVFVLLVSRVFRGGDLGLITEFARVGALFSRKHNISVLQGVAVE